MRCSTRILLVTAFAIFAGLGLLAASTRTVAREPAPRSPAAQFASSEDDNDEAYLRERLECLRKRDALAARVAAEGRRLAQATVFLSFTDGVSL